MTHIDLIRLNDSYRFNLILQIEFFLFISLNNLIVFFEKEYDLYLQESLLLIFLVLSLLIFFILFNNIFNNTSIFKNIISSISGKLIYI